MEPLESNTASSEQQKTDKEYSEGVALDGASCDEEDPVDEGTEAECVLVSFRLALEKDNAMLDHGLQLRISFRVKIFGEHKFEKAL